ncbi:MAG TPA: hypothetical protein V6D22_05105 [Candidatus Obscuribacterales bacterium]
MIPDPLRLFLPNRAGWFFVLMLALFLFARPLMLLGDGDICRHLLTGLYFFQHHTLPATNYICAITPDSAWMTNSFAADVLYAGAYQLFGLNGVVALASFVIALAFTASYQIARVRGLGPMIGLLLLCLAAAISSMHWLARPHVLTWLLFIIYYYVVFVSNMKVGARCLTLAVITLVWANTHGSFYLGIGMLVCKLIGDLLQPKSGLSPAGTKESGLSPAATIARIPDSFVWNIGVLVATLAAAALNTHGGANFLLYIFQFLGSAAVANSEWRNIDFSLGTPVWCFIALILITVAIVVYSPRRPRLAEFGFALALFAYSLYAMRIMPYFALLALPAMAPQWSALRESMLQSNSKELPLRSFKAFIAADARAEKQEPDSSKVVAIWCVAALAVLACFFAMPQFKLTDFDPEKLPVACTDYIKTKNLSGLGFTQDDWAAYLYWKTGERIFIDDYTDLYPPQLVHDYTRLYFTYPDWQSVIKKYNFQYILLPRGLPLAQLIAGDSNWKKVCEDPASMLFVPAK